MDKLTTKSTTPNVFIIKSLEFEDEDRNLFEGQIISGSCMSLSFTKFTLKN